MVDHSHLDLEATVIPYRKMGKDQARSSPNKKRGCPKRSNKAHKYVTVLYRYYYRDNLLYFEARECDYCAKEKSRKHSLTRPLDQYDKVKNLER